MPGVRQPCLMGSSAVTAPGARGAAPGEGGRDRGRGGPGPAWPGGLFATPLDSWRVAASENTNPASPWPGRGAARGLLGQDEEARPRPGCGPLGVRAAGIGHGGLFTAFQCLPVAGDFPFEKVSNSTFYAEAVEVFFFRRFHVPRVSSEHGWASSRSSSPLVFAGRHPHPRFHPPGVCVDADGRRGPILVDTVVCELLPEQRVLSAEPPNSTPGSSLAAPANQPLWDSPGQPQTGPAGLGWSTWSAGPHHAGRPARKSHSGLPESPAPLSPLGDGEQVPAVGKPLGSPRSDAGPLCGVQPLSMRLPVAGRAWAVPRGSPAPWRPAGSVWVSSRCGLGTPVTSSGCSASCPCTCLFGSQLGVGPRPPTTISFCLSPGCSALLPAWTPLSAAFPRPGACARPSPV